MLQKYTQMVAVTKCIITKNKKQENRRCLQLTNWFANRVNRAEKSKSPALNVGYNSHKKVQTKRFFTTKTVVLQPRVGTMTPKT